MSAASKLLPFVKMEGAGNDYIYVDGIRHPFDVDAAPALAARLSDRHRGIGADGLIVLAKSDRADCRMLMWNADGSRGQMCGNGIRCLAVLAHDLGHVAGTSMTIESDAGVHAVELVVEAGAVTGARVDMGDVVVEREAERLVVEGSAWAFHRGSVGNPHAVIFCEQALDDVPVLDVGAAFQRHHAFRDGVNVEFVRVSGEHVLEQRTYERGSGETLACGSGATVAALAAMVTGRLPGPAVEVRLRGGTLIVRRDGSRLVMEGPARTVFFGEVPIGAGR